MTMPKNESSKERTETRDAKLSESIDFVSSSTKEPPTPAPKKKESS